MKIIKIYSSWNQLKLKARAGHYNTEAHVRIWVQGRWELSEGGGDLRQRRQHKTFIGEKCAPGPRCEVSWALDRLRDNGGYQCLHQECVSNIRATITITTLTASQQYNLANMARRPEAPGPWSPGMMVTSLVRPDSVSLFVQSWETNVWLWVTSCDIRARVTRGRGSWGHQRIVWDDLSSCVTMTPGCW